jgi:hypothetical protein
VPFDENGGWNATEILERMSQLEGTPTATPDYLPGAGEESDRKRCGSNASLASAIVAGPRAVITLCQNLVKRIDDYRTQGAAGGAEMPSAAQADEARASVRRIMLDVYYGSTGMAHEGGGGTLQYRDLDRLAHWLYVFSYKPDDPGRVAGRGGVGEMQGEGRRWRTPAEVADAAKLAGYGLGSDWELLWTWELLTDRVDALPDGGSMLVLISNDPMAPNAKYIHTITFFRRGGVSFVHDSWGAGNVYPSTDPRYRASVKGAYDSLGGLKPRGLLQAPPRKEPSLMDWYLLNRPG